MQARHTKLYWFTQIFGWLLYVAASIVIIIVSPLTEAERWEVIKSGSIFLIIGFWGTHLMRWLIFRFELKKLPPVKLLLPVLSITSGITFLSVGVLFVCMKMHSSISDTAFYYNFYNYVQWFSNYLGIYTVWVLIYFAVNYFRNYRSAQIAQLTQQAAINEATLNKLRSQLNPHFIFNALNSIRALVDQDPEKCRSAITALANIFRKSLQMDKVSTVPFDEELQLIKDYLNLESIRYEERLQISMEIGVGSSSFRVPPLMLQTLIENGIKHGIATLAKGGEIRLKTKVSGDILQVEITNPGQYYEGSADPKGFGIKSTKDRLRLLYGEKAAFTIGNDQPGFVKTNISIPKEQENDKGSTS